MRKAVQLLNLTPEEFKVLSGVVDATLMYSPGSL